MSRFDFAYFWTPDHQRISDVNSALEVWRAGSQHDWRGDLIAEYNARRAALWEGVERPAPTASHPAHDREHQFYLRTNTSIHYISEGKQ